MPKTILKLYENGNFETVDTLFVQSEIVGNYSFNESSITVPKIIEYPPVNYRNYFIEKTSVPGWVSGNTLEEPNEADRTSDFIDVSSWEAATMRVRYYDMDGAYSAWVTVVAYNESKLFLESLFDDFVVGDGNVSGDFEWQFQIPVDASYIRISTTYYDRPSVTVKVSVEEGYTDNSKHYLAPEDLPEWVVDTGQPISIFKEGIVIKGDLIHSNS